MIGSSIYLFVSLAVSLAMSALSAGVTVNSLQISSSNQKLRSSISSFVRDIKSEISSGRLSVSKLISLLQSRNQNAMMNYLQNNPVISRNLEGIQRDSDLLASLQAEQTALESEIADLTNEINTLGYSQSSSGLKGEKNEFSKKKQQLEDAKKRYQNLAEKAKGVGISTTNPIVTRTSDIDARSQNINGGLNN